MAEIELGFGRRVNGGWRVGEATNGPAKAVCCDYIERKGPGRETKVQRLIPCLGITSYAEQTLSELINLDDSTSISLYTMTVVLGSHLHLNDFWGQLRDSL